MSDIAIQVSGLGKSYQISHQRSGYHTLRDDLLNLLPGRRKESESKEIFWALRDVSFEVKTGEVLGVIGRNGAGKSTLLKILARITKPSTGYADIFGRVGSLLEVGTGFHPELTGRENIYLSGTILGMRRHEIQRKFDEIIAFAEVEQFLDTPVKRFSSGMYTRLAFSVAAHLDPEILIVDEVLAVGDSAFQKKSLGKMGDVARSGRTVLFVSHNMVAVQHLCTSGVLLEQGQVRSVGDIEHTIQMYMSENVQSSGIQNIRDRKDRQGEGNLQFTYIEFCTDAGKTIDRVLTGEDLRVQFHYESTFEADTAEVIIAFNVYNNTGVLLTNLNSQDVDKINMSIKRQGHFECVWRRFNLREGIYTCALYCSVNGVVQDWIQNAFHISVDDGNFFGTGSLISRTQGEFVVSYEWSDEPLRSTISSNNIK